MSKYEMTTFRGVIDITTYPAHRSVKLTVDQAKEYIEELNRVIELTKKQLACTHDYKGRKTFPAKCSKCDWFCGTDNEVLK